MDLENDHNVYILGAGFSADGGMPLIPNFLTRMRDSHPWLEERGRHREADAVRNVLEFRLQATSAGYWTSVDLENVEELFSLASVEGDGLLFAMREAIAATIDFCMQTASKKRLTLTVDDAETKAAFENIPWLGKYAEPGYEIPSYAFYVARLLGLINKNKGKPTGRNTFITFNYDPLVEDALAYIGIPFGYGFDTKHAKLGKSAKASLDPQTVSVFKLHGSLNWRYERLTDGRWEDQITIYGNYGDADADEMVSPEIVPPTWRKVFDRALGDVWTEAIKSLHTATRLVIIGFSIPPTDHHFKFILSAGLKKNISLRQVDFIDRDITKLKPRAESVFRSEHISAGKIQFTQTNAESYLTQHDGLARMGRPVPTDLRSHVTFRP